jgi:hypothetical protein
LAGAANEKGHGTTALAANMEFAFEDKDHVLGGSAFLVENVAGLGDVLLAVASKPEAIFIGETVQWADAFEGNRDFFYGSGTGRRGDGWGKHPGNLRVTDSG